jgi:fumarate hydratase class II
VETDSMGKVKIPSEKYWGAQTQRSLQNFEISDQKMPINVIYAFAYLKAAAAIVNNECNQLSKEKADLIKNVCTEILKGDLNDHFPLVVWQTGSGTHTNMNINEVIANRGNELKGQKRGTKFPLHPNDDVNMSQSSNDTFSTAMNIAACQVLKMNTLPNLKILTYALEMKAIKFNSIIKTGRTHLMDATPLTLGQEFSGYAAQLEQGFQAIENTLPHLSELAMGGTAVGTGINTPPGFADKVVRKIAELTRLPFKPASNTFKALAAHDAISETHGTLKTVATSLMKIGNDIRLLASGPRCGLNELRLPANEPGSSIMPGKVNPTQIEALTMVAAQVVGNDTAINIGCMNGQLELNVYKPMIIYNFLMSAHLIGDACKSFKEKCIDGLEPNEEKIKEYLQNSLMLVTALNPVIGYDKATQVAKKAFEESSSLKQAALELGYLSAEDYEKHVKPEKMIGKAE